MSMSAESDNKRRGVPSYLRGDSSGPWTTYLEQIERVTPCLGDLAGLAETLVRPKRIRIVDVPIELDNGARAHFEGYRVQHNIARGPGKGGVRTHPAGAPHERTLPLSRARHPVWRRI